MTITLESDVLEVSIAPERGADIVGIADRTTKVQTLAASPTGSSHLSGSIAGSSMMQWLNGYPGGWQVLLPNAGPERMHDGVTQGYHGEASLARWNVTAHSPSAVTLETRLFTAPLGVERTVSLDHGTLRISDTVTNLSPEACSFRMGQHPAFGSPFLDEHSYVVVHAATLIVDASAPGTLLEPGVVGRPHDLLTPGPVPHSLALPGPNSGQALFAALTDFPPQSRKAHVSTATFMSPTHGFGMQLQWDASVYRNAWFWIEANAGSGWPWFKRLFAIAIEPMNVLPGEGTASNGRQRGGPGSTLEGGESLTSNICVTRVPVPRIIADTRGENAT